MMLTGIRKSALVLMFTAIVCTMSASAQTPPNMEAVYDSIANPNSEFYYPTLFERYKMGDPTLTLDHYHHLYYGYTQHENYKPLLDNSAHKELENIITNTAKPTASDYNRAIKLTSSILNLEPFNPRDLNALAYLYAMTGQEEKATEMMNHISMILQTIQMTGSGTNKKSPWHITYLDHAEDIMNMRGDNYQTPIIISDQECFYPVSNLPQKKDRGLYFNFGEVYRKDQSYLQGVEAPKRRMNFNPLNKTEKYKL